MAQISSHHRMEQEQKCALVTGSNNGIGESIVLALARLDYKLVVTGRNGADVTRVAKLCADQSPSGSKPLEIVADLEQESDVRRLFDESSRHFDGRLDLLVNNAGIGIPVDHTQVEECWQSFRRTMQVNLMAAAQLTLLAAPLLKSTAEKLRQRDSDADSLTCTTCIINIGSIAALRPTQTLAAYGTSKMALNMYSQCMACELAPLIRVNCINPGPIATKLVERAGFDLNQFKQICAQANPLNRIGRADEVAQAVLYLADWSKSGYITGAQLSIDGGCVLSPVRWNLQ